MAPLLCSLTGGQISGMKFSKTPSFTKCVTLRLGDKRMIHTGRRSGRAWLESKEKHRKPAAGKHDDRDREIRKMGMAAAHQSELRCPDPVGDPLLRFIRFIQFVILVVLRTLQGQLQCEAALGDLVDPDARGNFSRSRVSCALLAYFGRSVRLR